MKVLFLSPTGTMGGAERVLLSALAAVQHAGSETRCHLLALSDGPLVPEAERLGVQTSVLPAPAGLQAFGDSKISLLQLATRGIPFAWNSWRYARRLRQKIHEFHPDLIHSNGIKTHALLWLAGTSNIPVLWHVHDFLSRRSLAKRILGLAVKRIAGAIAISGAVAADLKQLWPTVPIFTVTNAIDTERFCPGQGDGDLLDNMGNLPKTNGPCLRLGLLATYARWKGHDVFLRAAARVLRELPKGNCRFYVIGGPIYATAGSQTSRAELEELTRQLQIQGSVGFIDFQVDVRPVLRSLDAVVHASTAPEPFGLTIIEAMACGKPVIIAESGGAAEIIHPGEDAMGVSPGDEASLAGAMIKILLDKDLRISMGRNARRTVCEKFDQQRFAREIVEVIGRFQPSRTSEIS